jgi:hypothetical protein
MQITRNSLETTPGPSEWFTGAVYIDTVATPSVTWGEHVSDEEYGAAPSIDR